MVSVSCSYFIIMGVKRTWWCRWLYKNWTGRL